MAERTFASWVEPIAADLRADRARVVGAARAFPTEAWSRPAPLGGWTYKDILAHLAGGNDQMVQKVLRSVVAGAPIDRSVLNVDTDAENARGVAERRARSVGELIVDLEDDGEEVQELLSGLQETDEDRRKGDVPISVGEFLRLVQAEHHDLEHLAQLRTALDR